MLATANTSVRHDQAAFEKAVREYNEYFDALRDCFVGRERIVEILRRAMAQRQHMLLFGPPGTTKTAICDVAFSGITNASKFHVELSMYMTEDALFGPYDAKRMREDGELVHRVDGMLPQAHFARVGEFLDGNMATLRALLSSLHERRMRRGRQVVDMPLLTVYCDTNQDPGEFLKRNPYAWAVLDRLLFMSHLDYLQDDEQIVEMLMKFQEGRTARISRSLPLETVHKVSEPIVYPPSLITDHLIYRKLGEALGEYRRTRKQNVAEGGWKIVLPEISDRRLCFASQMLETEAVLKGRLTVFPDDMLAVADAIGTTEQEFGLWREIAGRKIQEIADEKNRQLNHAQAVALESLRRQAGDVDLGNPSESAHAVKTLLAQLDAIAPENDEIAAQKAMLTGELEDLRHRVQQEILRAHGLGDDDSDS